MFSSCSFKINMNKNSVKYLQGIDFYHLTFILYIPLW